MNILELDSYNLADAVKFNDHLNPILWGSDEQLKPEVREKLLAIADEFREFLGVNDLQLKDITISGSNAAYTYTPHSDIDLHLVVDLPEADRNEVYRELFDAKKYVFNDMHDIKIGGYDVELYVQDANKPHHSQGIYSVVNNDWVDVPKRRRTEIDDVSTQSKYEDLSQRIDTAIASDSYKQMSSLTEKIRAMRQAGLDEHGEFGPENLAFKMLRTQGQIKRLHDARNAARDQELSLAERDRKKPVFRYGFGRPHIEEDAGETWDGVNPTTCMFLNEEEPTDEDILKDFIDFCSKELKLEHMPTIKLRRDPQWSVVHKTFGRYVNDRHLLEVAWGQRHIMDILRTVAHELTHKHQHEREEVPVTAGETGSEYENEANARAGVLMRDYARLHPEFFAAGQAEELNGNEINESKEFCWSDYSELPMESIMSISETYFLRNKNLLESNNPETVSYFTDLFNFGQHPKINSKYLMTLLILADDQINVAQAPIIVRVIKQLGPNQYTVEMPDGTQADYPYSVVRDKMVYHTFFFSNESQYKKLQTALKIKFDADLPNGPKNPVKESASGYIPTRKQAKDPRWSMALTKDIRPGAVGLNANKLRLNTDRRGQPQIANTNGVVQRMKEQLELFKKTGVAEVLDTTPGKANRAKWNNRADMVELDFVASNGIKYTLSFIPPYMGPDEFNQYTQLPDATDEVLDAGAFVDFEQTSKNPYGPGKQGIEGTGSAAEVFGIVYNAVLQYVKKHQPTYLFFQAAELNRRSLYTVLIRKMLPAMPGWKFKQAGGEFVVYNTKYFKKNKLAEAEELDEVRMSPTALKKFAASPAAKGILVGFEAELIFPDVRIEDEDPEYEPDYEQDTRPSSIREVIEFFSDDEWGYGLSERQQERLRDNLDEVYMEWMDEQMMQDFKQEAEDLVKKVMIDEKDWIQEDEVRKQLDMMDVTGEDQEAVLAAGSRAPRFNSSAEQQAYMEEHPEYEKYIEALGEAEELLDELVQDSVRAQDKYWDAAIDDFRDYYSPSDDSGFFGDVGLRYMSDVSNRFDLGWPYMTSNNDGDGHIDIEDVATSLKDVVQMPVTASGGYHQATRKPGRWIVEPDSSLRAANDEDGGLEIISPPMPIEQAMQKLQAVIDWAQKRGCYTNSSTGLHMGVSLPGQQSFAEAENDAEPAPVAEKPIDFVKLALFLGDQHVLKQFEREANNYCRSSLEKLKAKNWSPQQIATAMEKMRGNLINLAYKDLADRSPGRDSINMKDNYVEFRSAGGDYLSKESDQGMAFLENTLLRYVRALAIAGDPTAERQEYAKKLYKLISPEGDTTLDLFSKFATGEITSEQLKKDWAKKTLEKDKPKQGEEREWEAYNPATGEVLGTVKDFSITNATNYFRDEMKLDRFQVREKEPELTTSRAKLAKQIIQKPAQAKDYNYEIVNLGDVNLGVVDKFYATDKQDADATFDKWLKMKDLPNDTSNYGYRPRKQDPTLSAQDAADLQHNTEPGEWEFYRTETGNVIDRVNDADRMQANAVRADIVRRYGHPDASVGMRRVDRHQLPDWRGDLERHVQAATTPEQDPFERNSDRIDAIRGRTPDATEQEGDWQIVDVTVNQPVETYQGTWAEADRIATQYETGAGERNGHEISVRGA
jgi:hypothetical protein